LKEQKSYKINRLVIKIENDITDNLLLDIIKYFSFIYDEIIIDSSFHLTYLRDFFYYDITILFTRDNPKQFELERIDYKKKVIIENNEYSNRELYTLFNISENELI
jgi:hypothetical protein